MTMITIEIRGMFLILKSIVLFLNVFIHKIKMGFEFELSGVKGYCNRPLYDNLHRLNIVSKPPGFRKN